MVSDSFQFGSDTQKILDFYYNKQHLCKYPEKRGENICSLDPTANQYPKMCLGIKNTYGRFYVWPENDYNEANCVGSSSEHGVNSVCSVAGGVGAFINDLTGSPGATIPVKEL